MKTAFEQLSKAFNIFLKDAWDTLSRPFEGFSKASLSLIRSQPKGFKGHWKLLMALKRSFEGLSNAFSRPFNDLWPSAALTRFLRSLKVFKRPSQYFHSVKGFEKAFRRTFRGSFKGLSKTVKRHLKGLKNAFSRPSKGLWTIFSKFKAFQRPLKYHQKVPERLSKGL